MSDDDPRAVVVRMIATELKIDEVRVRDASSLKMELKMDSIAAVNVAFALEDEYGIEINLDNGESFDSVGSIVDIVSRALGRS